MPVARRANDPLDRRLVLPLARQRCAELARVERDDRAVLQPRQDLEEGEGARAIVHVTVHARVCVLRARSSTIGRIQPTVTASNPPPHLLTRSESLDPPALIPSCAHATHRAE